MGSCEVTPDRMQTEDMALDGQGDLSLSNSSGAGKVRHSWVKASDGPGAGSKGCAQHVKKVPGRERGQTEGAEALKEAMGVDGCE